MNLSTAQATCWAKEIGIRKVTGASKGRIIIQLLVESTVIAYISMILAAIIAEQAMPFFSSLVNNHLLRRWLEKSAKGLLRLNK